MGAWEWEIRGTGGNERGRKMRGPPRVNTPCPKSKNTLIAELIWLARTATQTLVLTANSLAPPQTRVSSLVTLVQPSVDCISRSHTASFGTPHLTCGSSFLLLFVFLISSILHYHPAVLSRHTLIMDRLLTHLVAFSILERDEFCNHSNIVFILFMLAKLHFNTSRLIIMQTITKRCNSTRLSLRVASLKDFGASWEVHVLSKFQTAVSCWTRHTRMTDSLLENTAATFNWIMMWTSGTVIRPVALLGPGLEAPVSETLGRAGGEFERVPYHPAFFWNWNGNGLNNKFHLWTFWNWGFRTPKPFSYRPCNICLMRTATTWCLFVYWLCIFFWLLGNSVIIFFSQSVNLYSRQNKDIIIRCRCFIKNKLFDFLLYLCRIVVVVVVVVVYSFIKHWQT